ncbi:MAG TPA: RodZ domain-containing protein [Candidatus Kapabacteria bacterium]|nr:RodZ domain-containing protein [Candidatus Kapabacteria bacterium]
MTASPGEPVSTTSSSDNGYDKAPAVSPGAQLQKARKERNLEIPAVAEQLNLSPGVVRALEADDYRMLPNATFVKGYLRSYARVLGIAGDDLVRAYETLTGRNKPVVVEPVAPPRIRKSGNSPKYAIIALLVAGLLGLVLWLMPGEPERTEPPMAIVTDPAALASADDGDLDDSAAVSADSAADKPALADASQHAAGEDGSSADAGSRDSESGFSLVTPEAAVTATGNPVSAPETPETLPGPSVAAPEIVVPAAPVAAPESSPVASEPVQAEPASTVPPSGRGMLKLAFSGDCWVEVRDVRGKMVFSSLKRAGDDVTLNVAVPVSVKLGNGDVVAVTFNGEPVAFSTTASRKVIRLTLGESD